MPPKEPSKAGAADQSAIQIGGLNASVMKPKSNKNTAKTTTSSSTGTGAQGEEDDPMGMIPKAGAPGGGNFGHTLKPHLPTEACPARSNIL